MSGQDIVVVGRLGSAHGVRGWMHLQSFTSPPENLLNYQPWFIQAPQGGAWRPLVEPKCRAHKKGYLTQLAGIDDRDDAVKITGSLVGVSVSAMPILDAQEDEHEEYYWRDLIGSRVFTETGLELGQVDHLLETGAHDVLVIHRSGISVGESGKDADHQVLIPFVADFVLAVDAVARTITVSWDPDW